MEKEIKNISSERIVVGILINHPEWFIHLNGLIRTEFFFSICHRTVYYCIYTLLKDNFENIDVMSILAKAERINKGFEAIQESGGYEYVDNLRELSTHYTIEELKGYCQDVVVCSYRRDQIRLSEEINEKIKASNGLSISEIENQIEQMRQSLNSKYRIGHEVKRISEVFDDTWNEIEDERTSDGIVGLPSKIPLVNKYFTYQNSELTIIGARAKFGKSIYGINEAHNLAVNHGIPVGYLDTEMKTKLFLARILALDSGIPIGEIRDGTYLKDIDKVMAVENSKERIKKAPLYHYYDYDWDLSKVKNTSKLLKVQHGIGLLIYDYIKVMQVSHTTKEHAELGNWTIGLKNLAGELNIPILSFGQLSPNETRLADSDKLNRYATTIAYLLAKSPQQMTRDTADGGQDHMYVDYNRIGKSMNDTEKGINLDFQRDIARISQSKYQILTDDYMR